MDTRDESGLTPARFRVEETDTEVEFRQRVSWASFQVLSINTVISTASIMLQPVSPAMHPPVSPAVPTAYIDLAPCGMMATRDEVEWAKQLQASIGWETGVHQGSPLHGWASQPGDGWGVTPMQKQLQASTPLINTQRREFNSSWPWSREWRIGTPGRDGTRITFTRCGRSSGICTTMVYCDEEQYTSHDHTYSTSEWTCTGAAELQHINRSGRTYVTMVPVSFYVARWRSICGCFFDRERLGEVKKGRRRVRIYHRA